MRRLYCLSVGLALSVWCDTAQSASTTLALNFAPAVVVSTSITCTVAYPTGQSSFTVPVVAGTKIATCTVAPSTWAGTIGLSGADASFFSMSGKDVVVGGTSITAARTYNTTITSTP